MTMLQRCLRSSLYPDLSFLPTLPPPEEEDTGGMRIFLTVTPVGFMLLVTLAALGFFYSRKR